MGRDSGEEGGPGGHTGGRKGPVTKVMLPWAVVWRSQSRALGWQWPQAQQLEESNVA